MVPQVCTWDGSDGLNPSQVWDGLRRDPHEKHFKPPPVEEEEELGAANKTVDYSQVYKVQNRDSRA